MFLAKIPSLSIGSVQFHVFVHTTINASFWCSLTDTVVIIIPPKLYFVLTYSFFLVDNKVSITKNT